MRNEQAGEPSDDPELTEAERTFADDYAEDEAPADEADDADYFEREDPDSDETLGLSMGGPY